MSLYYVQTVQCGGGDCISHCQRMQSDVLDGIQGRQYKLAKVIQWDLLKKYGVKVSSLDKKCITP